MKKKLLFAIIVGCCLFAVLLKPLVVSGDSNICLVTEDYFFVEAYKDAQNNTASSNETTFKVDGTFIGGDSIQISSPRSFTASDCEKYIANYENRYNAGISKDEAYCDENGCTNSGVDGEMYVNFNAAVEAAGGCANYVQGNMIEYNDVDVYVSDNQNIAGSDEVAVTIDREYSITDAQKSNGYVDAQGRSWTFIPVVLTVTMEYESSSECPNEIKVEEQQTCPASNTGGGINANCSGGSASGIASVGLTSDKYGTPFKDEEEIAEKFCPSYRPWERALADVTFEQQGRLSVSIDKSIYAGGGVNFSFNYNTMAKWNWCGTSLTNGGEGAGARCERHIQLPECPSGYTLVESPQKACQKVVCEMVCPQVNNDGTCATDLVESCEYEYVPYDCKEAVSVGRKTCYDAGMADQKIYEKAGEHYQNIEPADVKSQDSNNASDTNLYSITSGKHKAGNVSVSGTGGGAWPVGVQFSGTMQFHLYEACIDIYDPFEVHYVASGGCGKNQISGGRKYYVPLKYPDGKLFMFEATSSQISIVTDMSWDLNFKCGVNCYQKIYEDPPKNLGFKFIYRPIDISNPKFTVFPNRKPGPNWTYFMSQDKAIKTEMKRDNIEYEAVLTPEFIQKIKTINDDSTIPKYTDLRTVSPEGRSSVLNDEIGISLKNPGKNDYNNLGECTIEEECWSSDR